MASYSACLRRLVDPRELDLCDGRGEIVLRLDELRRLDRRERRALLDRIAETRDHPGDPARVGREQRSRAIAVDRDLSFGQFLADEAVHADGRDGEGLHLLGSGAEGPRRRWCLAGCGLVFAEESSTQPKDQDDNDHCGGRDSHRAELPFAGPCAPPDRRPAGRRLFLILWRLAHA